MAFCRCSQMHDGTSARADMLRVKWRYITDSAGLGTGAHMQTWEGRDVAVGNFLITTQLRPWIAHIWDRTRAKKRKCADME